jgi:hypothetical protein
MRLPVSKALPEGGAPANRVNEVSQPRVQIPGKELLYQHVPVVVQPLLEPLQVLLKILKLLNGLTISGMPFHLNSNSR